MILLDDAVALEELIADALQDQHTYAWPWHWGLSRPAPASHQQARRKHLKAAAVHVCPRVQPLSVVWCTAAFSTRTSGASIWQACESDSCASAYSLQLVSVSLTHAQLCVPAAQEPMLDLTLQRVLEEALPGRAWPCALSTCQVSLQPHGATPLC